jgi:hypothetical protein
VPLEGPMFPRESYRPRDTGSSGTPPAAAGGDTPQWLEIDTIDRATRGGGQY